MHRPILLPLPRLWPFGRTSAIVVGLLALMTALTLLFGLPVAWLLIGAPVAEEVVFRLGVQARLQAVCRRATAVVLSSALFALCHALPAGLSALPVAPWLTFFPGVAFGAWYAWRGQLHECVVLHGLCNAMWLIAPLHLMPFHRFH
jgi:uncharacterized protein